MIANGQDLLTARPIKDMLDTKVVHGSVSHGLGEAGYDIRIKQDIRFKRVFGLLPFHKIGDGRWKLGNFTLASAIEEFEMPPNLVGIVHDKSSWARRSLSVFNTVIEPGWKGFLTLELVYHGQEPLHIPAGSGIAQVIFHETLVAAVYNGKYNHQPDQPVPARG